MTQTLKFAEMTIGDHYAETFDGEDEALFISAAPATSEGFQNVTYLSLTHCEVRTMSVSLAGAAFAMPTPDTAELSVHVELATEYGTPELVAAVAERHEATAVRALYAALSLSP